MATPSRSSRSISPREATSKLAPKASTARITAGWGSDLVAKWICASGSSRRRRQQLGGHAVDVEHEERAAVLAHQVGEADARGVGGELASRDSRCGARSGAGASSSAG